MKRIMILLLAILPMMTCAQQLKIYTAPDGYKYFALYAYGLPREIVKTNQEIKDSKFGETGIMRRHHTTKYDDDGIGAEGFNSNQKMSFGFLIAPYNVDAQGNELLPEQYQAELDWYTASGWEESIDTEMKPDPWGNPAISNNLSEASTARATPSGCAAYKGPKGTDKAGSWRLPTQREALTMFTIMEHALTLQGANEVTNNIINGKYWTSTELKTSSHWRVWYVDSKLGSIVNDNKIQDGGARTPAYARCVKDIDDDPINE